MQAMEEFFYVIADPLKQKKFKFMLMHGVKRAQHVLYERG